MTIKEIDEEMRALEEERDGLKVRLRELQAQRDELVAMEDLSKNLSPGKLRAMQRIAAEGIPSAETVGEPGSE